MRRHPPATRRTSLTLVAGLAVILSLVIAPGVSAQRDDQDPELAFCQSVVALTASLASLNAIGADSSIEEFEAATDAVSEAAAQARESLRGLLEAQVADVESTVEGLRAYRDDVGDDQTIDQVVVGAVPLVAEVERAGMALGTVDCQAAIAEASPAA